MAQLEDIVQQRIIIFVHNPPQTMVMNQQFIHKLKMNYLWQKLC